MVMIMVSDGAQAKMSEDGIYPKGLFKGVRLESCPRIGNAQDVQETRAAPCSIDEQNKSPLKSSPPHDVHRCNVKIQNGFRGHILSTNPACSGAHVHK